MSLFQEMILPKFPVTLSTAQRRQAMTESIWNAPRWAAVLTLLCVGRTTWR